MGRYTNVQTYTDQNTQIVAGYKQGDAGAGGTVGSKPAKVEKIQNGITGSCAGAGSEQFHIYRNSRRREMDRLDSIEVEATKREEDRIFAEKLERNKREAEEKVLKNSLKRKKKKMKQIMMKKKSKGEVNNPDLNNEEGGDDDGDDDSDNGDSIDENKHSKQAGAISNDNEIENTT